MSIELKRIVVTLALIASFMVYVDGTIVNLALAQLGSDLHASRSELEWAVNAYTLSFAAVMLGAGAITDVAGARRTFIVGLVIFTASSAICAAAGTMMVLNVARLAQGVGSALLLPSALVLATIAETDQHGRHRLLGWWAAAGGIGMAAGPLLGGVLVSLLNWRAVFGVNVVIGIPAIVWSVRSMPSSTRRERRLDPAGMVAATVVIGSLVFGLIEAPAKGWGTPPVLTAFALAFVGIVGFVQAERTVKAPLLPIGVYSDRSFLSTAVQGALFNFTFYGLLFAMSLMLQQGRGLSAIQSGLLFLPLTGPISLGSISAAALTRRAGRRVVLTGGQIVLAASLVAVVITSALPPLWPLAIALLPAGLSAGVLVPTMTAQSLAAVPPSLHGAASAIFNTSRQVGAAIGVATFGPLLGRAGELRGGFITCVLVAAAATVGALIVTLINRGAAAPSMNRPPVDAAG